MDYCRWCAGYWWYTRVVVDIQIWMFWLYCMYVISVCIYIYIYISCVYVCDTFSYTIWLWAWVKTSVDLPCIHTYSTYTIRISSPSKKDKLAWKWWVFQRFQGDIQWKQFGGSYQDVRQRLWRGIGGDQSAVKDCGLGQLEQKGSWVWIHQSANPQTCWIYLQSAIIPSCFLVHQSFLTQCMYMCYICICIYNYIYTYFRSYSRDGLSFPKTRLIFLVSFLPGPSYYWSGAGSDGLGGSGRRAVAEFHEDGPLSALRCLEAAESRDVGVQDIPGPVQICICLEVECYCWTW